MQSDRRAFWFIVVSTIIDIFLEPITHEPFLIPNPERTIGFEIRKYGKSTIFILVLKRQTEEFINDTFLRYKGTLKT